MSGEFVLYHGSTGDNILRILAEGSMRPDASHKVYFSEQFHDALQHGADLKRKATFAFKATIRLPAGASKVNAATPGNPRAVIVTTVAPIPTTLLELYVRLPRAQEVSTIKGTDLIKAYLLR